MLNVNQMATYVGYNFKAARTANLKNGLTAGKKRACPVKSTGRFFQTVYSPRPRRRGLHIVRGGFFICENSHLSLTPSLLLSAKRHARAAYSLASALATAPARCHRFAVCWSFSFAGSCLKDFELRLF